MEGPILFLVSHIFECGKVIDPMMLIQQNTLALLRHLNLFESVLDADELSCCDHFGNFAEENFIMSGVGFSITSGPGIDVQRVYGFMDFQTNYADRSLVLGKDTADQMFHGAKVQAVAQVLAAFVAKAPGIPSQKDISTWTKEIVTAIDTL